MKPPPSGPAARRRHDPRLRPIRRNLPARILLACPAAIGAVGAVGVIGLWASAASGGGSWLWPLEERYEPGEVATLQGTVSSSRNGFYAYLRVDPETVEREHPDTWPYIHPTDLLLAEIETTIETTSSPGWGHLATVEFVVPDVEPGQYDVVHCNDPCTDALGDLIGGVISIGHDPPYPLTEAGQAAATTAAEAGPVPPGAFPGLGADPAVATQTTQTDDASVDGDEQARVEPATDRLDSSVPTERRPDAATVTGTGLHWSWYVMLAAVGSAAIAMSALSARRRRHGAPASSTTEQFVDLGEIEIETVTVTETDLLASALREQ